jgi:purine-binding chemotaxis protein CheW
MGTENQSSEVSNLAGKYLTFSLASERYGLEILKVQEIIGVPTITRIPKSPDYIKGVINLRGRIIPLVDLRVKFGLEPVPYDEKTCIVVVNISTETQTMSIGVIVDTVLEVLNFQGADIEPAPDYGMQIESKFIVGMAKRENADLNILVDINKALNDADRALLAKSI